MGDIKSAQDALEREIELSLNKLPDTWQLGERVVRPNTDHVARLFTQLCALQFESNQLQSARETCGLAMENSELGMNVDSFLFAGEIERVSGNLTFAVKFYERAMSAQTMKEANYIEEEVSSSEKQSVAKR